MAWPWLCIVCWKPFLSALSSSNRFYPTRPSSGLCPCMEIEFILLIFLFATAFTVRIDGFLKRSSNGRSHAPNDTQRKCNNLDDERTQTNHTKPRENGSPVIHPSTHVHVSSLSLIALRPSPSSSCPSFPPQVPCIIRLRRTWRSKKKTVGVDYRNEGGSRQSRKVSVKTINVKPKA